MCAVVSPWLAFAQPAPGAAGAQTNGVKMGEGRLHVSANAEARYDSAAGLIARSAADPTLRLGSEFITRIGPGVSFDMTTDALDFRVGGNVDYVAYTGLISPGSSFANRVEAAADVGLVANKGGPLEVQLTDTFSRSDRTTNTALGYGVLALGNTAQLRLPIRPGQGALEITPEVGYGLEYYSPLASLAAGCTDASCNPAQVARFNYQNLHGGLEGRWRFLPRTALVLNTEFDHRFFPDAQGASPTVSLLQTTAGLSGLLTQRLALSLRAGWAFNLGETGGNTFVGSADLSYPITTTSMVRGGYQRSFLPVGVYGTMRDDRLYLDGRFLLGGKLTISAGGALDFLSFPTREGSVAGRDDLAYSLHLGPEYQFTPWLTGAVGYTLGSRSSTLAVIETLNFTRHEGYFRLTTSY